MSYFKWDPRPHGWYIDGDRTVFGPLPEKVRFVSEGHKHSPGIPRVVHESDPLPRREPYDPAAKWRA